MTQSAAKIMFLQEKCAPFQEMVRFFALQNFNELAKREDSKLTDHPTPDDYIYGSHSTYIQVMGDSFSLKLKNHFSISDASNVLDFAGEMNELEKQKLLIDFFSELNNILAGKISEYLNRELGVGTGTSFPVALSGIDSLLSSEIIKPSASCDYFIISGQGFEFVYSLTLDTSESILNSFYFDNAKQSLVGSDEMEFL